MHGRNLTEPDELADRWREYCEDVYIAEVTRNVIDERQENEPSPLRSEVIRPLQRTADRNSVGPDKITVELLKAGGDETVTRMHQICTALLETGEWPEKWICTQPSSCYQ